MVNTLINDTKIKHTSILKKKNYFFLYIYNNNYVCFLKINNKLNLNLTNQTQTKLENCSKSNNNNVEFFLKNFVNQFSTCLFIKIKFAGKGYKIKKKNKNSILLLFNRSHITTLWWKNIVLRKLKKYKIYLKYTYIYKNIISTILNIRYTNIFTKKGLRKSRQCMLKKKGKK